MRSRLSSRLSFCAWVGLALSILTAEICEAQRPDAKGLALLATAQPIAPAPDAGPLVGKLIERFNVSVEAYQHVYLKYKRGYTGIDPVFESGKRLFDARMELAAERGEGVPEQLEILNKILDILREQEDIFQKRVDHPLLRGAGLADLARVKYARLSVEIGIERLKQAPKPDPAQPAPATEPKPKPVAEPKSEPKLEPKLETKSEPAVEPAVEPKPESKPEPNSETKPEPKPEPAAEPEPEPKPEPSEAPSLP